jgi:hypothetical protein
VISTVALGSTTTDRVVAVVKDAVVVVVDEGIEAADVVVLEVVDVEEDVVVDVREEVEAAGMDVVLYVVVVASFFVIPRSEFVAKSTPTMTTAAIIACTVFMPVYL